MMVDAAGGGPITLETLLSAHRLLMAPDYYTARDSGKVRDVQHWVGGSDYTPIDALYVPPPPELVDDLMADLVEFAKRTDLPILAQAAIAHASSSPSIRSSTATAASAEPDQRDSSTPRPDAPRHCPVGAGDARGHAPLLRPADPLPCG